MAYTTIDDSSAHFQIALHTTSGVATITNDGNSDLQPDFIWSKGRNATDAHGLFDSSRGVRQWLRSNTNDAEITVASGYDLTAFNSDGFSTGNNQYSTICGGSNYAAWQWKANGGTRTTFTESGDNPGGGYQANTTSGFSIVDYTGTGATGTVTHGLGVAPKFIIIKNRGVADSWAVLPPGRNDLYLVLDTTVGWADEAAFWNDTSPSSTVFTVSTDHSVNADGETYIAYCFAEVQGYSQFGTYYGNASTDGAYVHLGFKPALVIFKVVSDPNYGYSMMDNARSPFNLMDDDLYANSNAAEVTDANKVDFLSTGFKLRNSTWPANAGGTNQFVYFAWAENPFVTSTGVPVTAG
tara:strand:+ start:2909 stop:3967 length:1059 start_codon:yes stop_codon:yes gene_type:complete